MLASVPYHLVENPQVFLISTEITNPDLGRILGGLLLVHPLYLYVTSQMRFLDKTMREYMLRCLAWIGEYMWIRQTTVLVNVRGRILNQTLEPIADFTLPD
jgi:hypothetical protein